MLIICFYLGCRPEVYVQPTSEVMLFARQERQNWNLRQDVRDVNLRLCRIEHSYQAIPQIEQQISAVQQQMFAVQQQMSAVQQQMRSMMELMTHQMDQQAEKTSKNTVINGSALELTPIRPCLLFYS